MIQVWEMCGWHELWALDDFALLWGWAQEQAEKRHLDLR